MTAIKSLAVILIRSFFIMDIQYWNNMILRELWRNIYLTLQFDSSNFVAAISIELANYLECNQRCFWCNLQYYCGNEAYIPNGWKQNCAVIAVSRSFWIEPLSLLRPSLVSSQSCLSVEHLTEKVSVSAILNG